MQLKFLFVIYVLLLLLSLSLFASLASYFVLLICYSAIRILGRKCGIKLSFCFCVPVTKQVSKSSVRSTWSWLYHDLP